ncbi:MAG: hypothetical protein JXR45_23270 [Deltaproteobacteria bacterium]|nr:hypothetical protein [Deltaproteobacteria bacterium]
MNTCTQLRTLFFIGTLFLATTSVYAGSQLADDYSLNDDTVGVLDCAVLFGLAF